MKGSPHSEEQIMDVVGSPPAKAPWDSNLLGSIQCYCERTRLVRSSQFALQYFSGIQR